MVLPKAMDASAHGVIHQIIARSNVGKDLVHCGRQAVGFSEISHSKSAKLSKIPHLAPASQPCGRSGSRSGCGHPPRCSGTAAELAGSGTYQPRLEVPVEANIAHQHTACGQNDFEERLYPSSQVQDEVRSTGHPFIRIIIKFSRVVLTWIKTLKEVKCFQIPKHANKWGFGYTVDGRNLSIYVRIRT